MILAVYALQRLYNCDIDSADSCDVAYAKYIVCYNREHDEQKKQIFCNRFTNLKAAEQSCPECNVNGIMDREIPMGKPMNLKLKSMPRHKSVLSKLRDLFSRSVSHDVIMPEKCYNG